MSFTISEIFRHYAAEYLEKYGDNIPICHLKAIRDIINCRTPVMGGTTYYCNKCKTYHYSYHSCKNRSCPKCQSEESGEWLEKQLEKLLPVKYHLVTFTLPAELRSIARSNQRKIFTILFKTAASCLQKFAEDPKYIGAQIGMIGVLHTWSRSLCYHPHVHFIVPGGGYDMERNVWKKSHDKFLFPVRAVSKVFRAKFRKSLAQTRLKNEVPSWVWKKDFVVHSKPVGKGEAALKYLAQYVYRIAISNKRIVKVSNHKIKFSYKESSTGNKKTMTLDVLEFMRRFLQHVLPAGFQKVRYYGFLSSAAKKKFEEIKVLLKVKINHKSTIKAVNHSKYDRSIKCPKCGSVMIIKEENRYSKRAPPKLWMSIFMNRSF